MNWGYSNLTCGILVSEKLKKNIKKIQAKNIVDPLCPRPNFINDEIHSKN